MWHKESSQPYVFGKINEYIYVNPIKIVGINKEKTKLLNITIRFAKESDRNIRTVQFPIYKSFDSVKYREDTYERSTVELVTAYLKSVFESKDKINKDRKKRIGQLFNSTYFYEVKTTGSGKVSGGKKPFGMVPQTWLNILGSLAKYAKKAIIEKATQIISTMSLGYDSTPMQRNRL